MATQIATKASGDPLRQAIEQMAPEFRMALPAHVPPEKFVRMAMTAINSNPELRDADRRSLFGSLLNLANVGLMPDGREAALVIFSVKNRKGGWEKRVQAMPMIAGLFKLMRQSGEVAWVDAHIVCANDRFVYRPGIDEVPIFEPDWFGDRGEPIGAYAIARLKTGEIVPPEIMSVQAIEKVRAVSRSKDRGPWVDWWEQMALKTVCRRFFKRLPTSADVDRAIESDETMRGHFDGEPVSAVEHQPEPKLRRLDALEHHIEEEAGAEVEYETDTHGPDPHAVDESDADNDADGLSPSEQFLNEMRASIEECGDRAELKALDENWVRNRAAYDDETASPIDAAIASKRKTLAGEG